jgi:hypothetical protein
MNADVARRLQLSRSFALPNLEVAKLLVEAD